MSWTSLSKSLVEVVRTGSSCQLESKEAAQEVGLARNSGATKGRWLWIAGMPHATCHMPHGCRHVRKEG